MHGVERVEKEFVRQRKVKGYTPAHDDEHENGELAQAAACYAQEVSDSLSGTSSDPIPAFWPWDEGAWKPSDDPIRNLEKAGALIVAEIERLLREREREE